MRLASQQKRLSLNVFVLDTQLPAGVNLACAQTLRPEPFPMGKSILRRVEGASHLDFPFLSI